MESLDGLRKLANSIRSGLADAQQKRNLINIGAKIVIGEGPPKPLRGFPAGKIRLRLRNDDFATATIRTKEGVRRFYIEERDDAWYPLSEVGRNETVEIKGDESTE